MYHICAYYGNQCKEFCFSQQGTWDGSLTFPQETSGLHGSVFEFCEERRLDRCMFCTLLRQLDFSREQLFRPMEKCSEGQKKKILLAAGLLTPAHLYLWDEPLNYIDVFSRMQIEQLLLKFQPTMLFVEHDVRFREQIATRTVKL